MNLQLMISYFSLKFICADISKDSDKALYKILFLADFASFIKYQLFKLTLLKIDWYNRKFY